ITSLLVEGGAEIHESFIRDGLWDEIRVEKGSDRICGTVKAPALPAGMCLSRQIEIDGNLISYYNKER
ncbi:MAG: riboflavin biosynthesis protein RibD, partial [Duncaniella sp.]|nr:riboflavin biosynthesis protein RibD [Duncaniella sp.]